MAGAESHKVGNLPSELSSFIGRRRELGDVKRVLGESRLVTLTGIGGTGKTRLALRVAAELRRALPDGVWFVDLTELHDPGLLCQEVQNPDVLAHLVRAALGLPERGGGAPLEVLVEQLADRRMLLVLDNCEHQLPVSAIVAHTLLRGCLGLRILATSREPLSIAGETLFAVPPLSAPDPGSEPSLVEMSRCEAVALFVARAETVVPGFGLTEDNHIAVAELCQRLDGLPLAIELAAARIRALAPQQILDRLADRFALLGRGSRSAPVRQQALRACMDWSFDLCGKPERILWARLSVFVGGFELDAVEGICTDEALPEADLLDLVAALVDKSILVRDDGHGGHARYRMLETIRAYGQEMLVQTDEQDVLRRRHRDWYQQLVTRCAQEWISDQQAYWLARIDRELPNLRAAIEFCLTEPDQPEAVLRIVVDLPHAYWWSQGMVREGSGWLDRALAHVTAPTPLRARGLALAAWLSIWHQDAGTVMRLLDEGQGLAERLGAPTEMAYAACMRGTVAMLLLNDLTGAVESLEQALTLLSAAPEPELVLRLLTLIALGTATGLAGDNDRASRCHQEILEITEALGESYCRSLALWAYGIDAWRQGDLTEAARCESECLRITQAQRLHDRGGVTPVCFEALAWIAASQRRHERAATLLGAAETLLADTGRPITSYPMLLADHDLCVREVRDALGDAAYDAVFLHGQALAYEDALAYALDERRQRTAPPAKDNSSPLTRRERQIADLVAQGMSNKDIAAKLFISQRTAESHVEHILTKLGFTSRAQVAAWVAEQRSDTSSA